MEISILISFCGFFFFFFCRLRGDLIQLSFFLSFFFIMYRGCAPRGKIGRRTSVMRVIR